MSGGARPEAAGGALVAGVTAWAPLPAAGPPLVASRSGVAPGAVLPAARGAAAAKAVERLPAGTLPEGRLPVGRLMLTTSHATHASRSSSASARCSVRSSSSCSRACKWGREGCTGYKGV